VGRARKSIDLKMRRPMSSLMSERKVMGVWKEKGPTRRSGAQGQYSGKT